MVERFWGRLLEPFLTVSRLCAYVQVLFRVVPSVVVDGAEHVGWVVEVPSFAVGESWFEFAVFFPVSESVFPEVDSEVGFEVGDHVFGSHGEDLGHAFLDVGVVYGLLIFTLG